MSYFLNRRFWSIFFENKKQEILQWAKDCFYSENRLMLIFKNLCWLAQIGFWGYVIPKIDRWKPEVLFYVTIFFIVILLFFGLMFLIDNVKTAKRTLEIIQKKY